MAGRRKTHAERGRQGCDWYDDAGRVLTRAEFRTLSYRDRVRIALANPPSAAGHVVDWDVVESEARSVICLPAAKAARRVVGAYLGEEPETRERGRAGR